MLLSIRDYGNFCALRTLFRQGEPCSGPAPRKCLACASSHYGRLKGTVATLGVLGSRGLIRRRVRGLHSCSGFAQEMAHRFLVDPGAAGLPDVDLPDWRDAESPDQPTDPEILAALPEQPFILFVGALRRIKGLEQLFAAHASLKEPPPLVLIGGLAPDTPPIPPGVTVLSEVPHPTVMAAWDRALFGVFPSVLPEPLGNVIHEAMSRGRAVIGTKPGGHGEMIADGENGLLVASSNIPALADAMRTLIADPELRTRMGGRGREIAERFTAEEVVPQFERLYREVIAAA